VKQGSLSIHTENIFPIIKKWLYSEHDIFIRELVSNAIDALNKRKAIDPSVKDEELRVEVELDKKKKTIKIIDSGIGMTADEIEKYINQIAFSGAEDFVEKFKDQQSNIIGHFGLGFYSSFMVSKIVTIDTLSMTEGSQAAFWECDGSTDYKISTGKRKKIGTTITLHLNDESEEYLEEPKMKELLEKYCNFMPYPIILGKDVVNQKEALWNRKPKDVTEEEYKEFYKKVFHDWQDPLFQIHLNLDFPFNLKGILYFPKLSNEIELTRGMIKLYCNNVFVADNLKEFVPEFLMMLRGGIDVPDIPLNVSRSFLQNDKEVQKIKKYIIRKVADQFKETFEENREKYEEYWADVNQFVKFGVLTEEDFSEAMLDMLIFKSSKGDYITVDQYLERNSTDEKSKKIYYGISENTQVSLLNLIKEQGIEVIFCDTMLDTHLLQHIEMKKGDLRFVRIDSEINETLIDESKKEIVDQDNKTESDKIKEEFAKALNNESVTVEAKHLKTDSIPAMVILDEFMRRFQEMNALNQGLGGADMLKNHTLVINMENPTIKKVAELNQAGKTDDAAVLAGYIHDLAMLEQKRFTGEELQAFVERANKILTML
ncbi:MAG: molecular chaperone HtpG, partial [Candidatus Cloacimonetes bacterium]|nr:molecular chaperone HtpG [Candidatus Cloacimonadota bacterium]